MCFGFYVKPQPPRRDKYGDKSDKYLRDYKRYEKEYENYMNKDNRRRHMANSNTGAIAGTSAAVSGGP
ncbi:hypothetical protein N7523_008495 [Penicillium sp. IBT 18751x]|nr:hypothetical protein N7523_008495 [Penicillium sp. IBT 18751x]